MPVIACVAKLLCFKVIGLVRKVALFVPPLMPENKCLSGMNPYKINVRWQLILARACLCRKIPHDANEFVPTPCWNQYYSVFVLVSVSC